MKIEYMATFCIDDAFYYVNWNENIEDIEDIINVNIKRLR